MGLLGLPPKPKYSSLSFFRCSVDMLFCSDGGCSYNRTR